MKRQGSGGPWFVWGDTTDPLLVDGTFDEMKALVDSDAQRGELYGENNDTGETYPEDA